MLEFGMLLAGNWTWTDTLVMQDKEKGNIHWWPSYRYFSRWRGRELYWS